MVTLWLHCMAVVWCRVVSWLYIRSRERVWLYFVVGLCVEHFALKAETMFLLRDLAWAVVGCFPLCRLLLRSHPAVDRQQSPRVAHVQGSSSQDCFVMCLRCVLLCCVVSSCVCVGGGEEGLVTDIGSHTVPPCTIRNHHGSFSPFKSSPAAFGPCTESDFSMGVLLTD